MNKDSLHRNRWLGTPRTRAAAALAALALGAAACGGSSSPVSTGAGPAPASSSGGGSSSQTLVIARNMDLTSTDPSNAICDTCQFVFSATYETLVGLSDDNKTLTPRLATSWTGSKHDSVWTFKLNPAAKFADGSPVTSADVKFSLLRLKNLKGNASYLVNTVSKITTPGPHTVAITLHGPNSEFPNAVNASYTGIINAKEAQQQGASDAADAAKVDKADKWFQSHSAGSGPYELQSFTSGSQVTLVANPNYWGTKPALKRIIVKQANTAAAQAQMLQDGEADMAMQIDPVTAKSLSGAAGITVKTIPSFNFFWIGMGQNISKLTQAPLNSDIRHAIVDAIDYQGLLNTMVSGEGKLVAAPIPNGYPGSAGLPLPKRNLAEAKQLLAKAGFPNGFKLTLAYPTINAYGVDLGQLAQLLQTQLKEAGIDLTLRPATFSVNIDDFSQNKLPMELLYWAPDYYGTAQYFNYFGLVPDSAWSHLSAATPTAKPVVNAAETKAFNQALASSTQAQRDQFFQQAGQQMINDAVTVPLFSPNLVLAYKSNLKGVSYSACCNIKLWQLSRS
ncbi:MAG: ABC transporter substrate-binding protein [Actinomycetota bacterium]